MFDGHAGKGGPTFATPILACCFASKDGSVSAAATFGVPRSIRRVLACADHNDPGPRTDSSAALLKRGRQFISPDIKLEPAYVVGGTRFA